jgi:hypothetical protein
MAVFIDMHERALQPSQQTKPTKPSQLSQPSTISTINHHNQPNPLQSTQPHNEANEVNHHIIQTIAINPTSEPATITTNMHNERALPT